MQHVKDHNRVQIRHEWREFNVRRVVRQVNTNVDEFVVDNAKMSDVDFDDNTIFQLGIDFVDFRRCFPWYRFEVRSF